MSLWKNAGRYRRRTRPRDGDTSPASVTSARDSSSDSVISDASAFDTGDFPSGPVVDPPNSLTVTRRCTFFGKHRPVSVEEQPTLHDVPDLEAARNIHQLQEFYHRYESQASKLFPPNVWRVVNAVMLEPKTTQSKVLQAVVSMLNSHERKQWPLTRQQIDNQIIKKLGPCYTRVMRSISIDLSHIGLTALTKPITFSFLDPIFAWTSCADKLSREYPLHFTYKPLYHPTSGELLYGASVQNGKIMQQACAKLPSR